jgi:RNA polymerase sigma factor (sigma-70 family)
MDEIDETELFGAKLELLIEQHRAGDSEAEGEILALIRPRIKSFASGYFPKSLNRRFDCSDIAQDTLISVSRKLPSFRGRSAGEFMSWAFWTVRAEIKNLKEKHIEAKKRTVKNEIANDCSGGVIYEPNASGTSPSVALMEGERLQLQFRHLPCDEQLVMTLLYIDCNTPERAAAAIGQTQEQIELTWFRALRRLRKLKTNSKA